jgi:hypothetical protein
MTIKLHDNIIQGSDDWFSLRCGILTASEMKLILTPTLKVAANEKERAHVMEIAAQRINKYTEPSYIGEDMLRGHTDEVYAKIKYGENYEELTDIGFITNDKWGFTIGYSPDGLVGDDGQIECKSRKQKYQLEVILSGKCPEEHILQVQTGLLVTERKWCDYVSYCGGMPMFTVRVYPDLEMQKSIVTAATAFEMNVQSKISAYNKLIESGGRLIPTERIIEQDIMLEE